VNGFGARLPALAPFWRYHEAVPSIQVKDVPDEVHATLRRRAAAAGQSLQEYLLARLIDAAHTPTLDEVLDRAGGRAGGRAGFEAATKAIRADRDAR
jgi:antitoxin FitA